jgi:hypothetical protein
MKKLLIACLLLALLQLCFSSCSPTPVPGCADTITVPSLSTGLIAYYKFPSSGSQLSDYGGNGYHLSNIGSVMPGNNRVGSNNCAMHFNGSNYLLAPATFPAIGAFSSTPFTVMLTYKPDGTVIPNGTYAMLMAQVCGAISPTILNYPFATANFVLGIDTCKVPFSTLNPNAAYAGSPCSINDSAWHNAAVTWDGIGTITVYQFTISGPAYSHSVTNGPLSPSCGVTNTIIGYGFKGIIDDIKIWNRVLTVSELSAAFNYDSPCCP